MLNESLSIGKSPTLDKAHINPHVAQLGISGTLAINERCNQLIKDGKTVYKFGLGQSPFPVPVPVVEALRLFAHEKDYLPVKGLPALREAVAFFHRKKDLVDVAPESVLIGPGSKELLFLLQLVFNGQIIITGPSWVSYRPQARILNKKISVLHTSFEDKWKIDPEKLRAVRKGKTHIPAFLILNYPGNPDGVTYTYDELQALAETARKTNIFILSDEIYGQLHHRGQHVSIARYYPEGTVISSGLSKWCGAGGWRLGTFSFPRKLQWLATAMAAVASETYTSVSAPIQYAAVRAFEGGIKIEEYLCHARRILSKLGTHCASRLAAADVRVHMPEGGFYLFLEFSNHVHRLRQKGLTTSALLCEKLLEDTGVALLPGQAFNRPDEEFSARMAYVDFDGARALAASEIIPLDEHLPDDFLPTYCGKVLEGVEHLLRWLQE
ncbi:MAG: aspartate aminotransferase [Chitinophagales bacterium]|nr:MAG: aspartate aminotransferase [Chitinophagales bacterium]